MSKISKQKIKISLIIIIAFLIALFIPKYENANVSYSDTQVIKGATTLNGNPTWTIEYNEKGKEIRRYVSRFEKDTGNDVTMADIKNNENLGYMFVVDTVSGSSRNIC